MNEMEILSYLFILNKKYIFLHALGFMQDR